MKTITLTETESALINNIFSLSGNNAANVGQLMFI